jgi:hypothetical protein
MSKTEHVSVEFWGLEPITGTVETSALSERFCTVTVLDNPNAGGTEDRGTEMVIPRAGLIMGAAWDAAHGL